MSSQEKRKKPGNGNKTANGRRKARNPTRNEEETAEKAGNNDSSRDPKPKKRINRNRSNQRGTTNGSGKANTDTSKNNAKVCYPPYLPLEECLEIYHGTQDDGPITMIRGKMRVLPGKDTAAFVSCDRGWMIRDVAISDTFHRNRALDGDFVYVELLEEEEEVEEEETLENELNEKLNLREEEEREEEPPETWQDDEIQMDIWNPQVRVERRKMAVTKTPPQRKGRVVHVVPPKSIASELNANEVTPRRRIVGSLVVLQSGTILLTPNNKSLPQFRCHDKTKKLVEELKTQDPKVLETTVFQAEYEYGSWQESHRNWPPCTKVQELGKSCLMEDEITALLMEYQVDHGEFPSAVLQNVDTAVKSGVYYDDLNQEWGWKPTPNMYEGRRDYRDQRIFTIDPTTAKDLDDALHITELPDGTIEIGVHIADVSFFLRPSSAVDEEAIRRATTVYLVDRTIPMLPRPLCEVACSLNENVERLAFSCVWKMNADGTLRRKKRDGVEEEDVWYGRTVIRSCARLDYSTAQNIIENKVARPGDREDIDEALWAKSRRPTGGHTIQQVASDVRLMHRVAMARRRLRFANGALALNSTKLTFQLDTDGQTPLLVAPYPIRDSNRLVEEYMLLANYLVAQRLVTHAKDRACLRRHPPPVMESMDKVAAVAKEAVNFNIDITSSQTLQESLMRLREECPDPLIMDCVTQMMTLPMQQAIYFAAGSEDPSEWRHFALNMPYYTHFTSPIRRYPDVIVHRLLQATLEGEEAVENYPQNSKQIQQVCEHCTEKQKAAKDAQSRCDRVFLSLYVRKHPIKSEMGIVLSVGRKAFTVFIPSLGADALLYLDEHKDMLEWTDEEKEDGTRRILLQQKKDAPGRRWDSLEIKIFTKVRVTVVCKEKLPIDIKLLLEGPWERTLII